MSFYRLIWVVPVSFGLGFLLCAIMCIGRGSSNPEDSGSSGQKFILSKDQQ